MTNEERNTRPDNHTSAIKEFVKYIKDKEEKRLILHNVKT